MSKVRSGTSIASLAGEEFGPYRLVRRLGVGGMAETYEAIRRGPSGFAQHVCLKLVLPFFRDNPDFIELFEREARLAAKLRHSNIVGMIDFGSIDGVPYMALELVDGADLRVLLDAQDGKRLSPDLVALVGTEVAAALEHAHAPNSSGDEAGGAIIHRDVSPSNVLISRRGEVFLSDFGVAKAMSGTSRQQSAVKGKVPYMSPEQLRAQPLDVRADLFALGVVMFEALGGRRPYEGAHDPATIMLTLEGDHPALAGLAPGAPPSLCDVIESLIRPNREDRPGSASEVIDLLDELVPSPRAKRRLGVMVEECRPPGPPLDAPETEREIVELTPAESTPAVTTGVQRTGDVAEATAPLGSGQQSTGQATVSTPRWRTGAMIFSVIAVALGAYALRSSNETVPTPEPATPAPAALQATDDAAPPPPEPPADEAQAEVPRASSAAHDSSGDTKPASPPVSSTAARPPRLTVIVFPWGNVWIDGKPRGPAPLKNEVLEPGRHRVSVGQDMPLESRTIRLRPGQRRSLEFDLTK